MPKAEINVVEKTVRHHKIIVNIPCDMDGEEFEATLFDAKSWSDTF